MPQAKQGDTVKVHYSGRLDDGSEFDSSRKREPLEFTLGEGHVIPGFEEGVMGMNIGDTKTIRIPSDQAYGPRREELELNVLRTEFPPDINPVVGEQLQLSQPDGQVVIVTISKVSDESVTLDANHPLAGKDLTFDLELMEIA